MLGWAVVLFALSSLFFLVSSYRLKAVFLYWYGKEHAGCLEEALGSLAENTRMEIDARARGGDVVPVEISISKTMVNREAITTLIVRGIRDRKLAE